MTEGYTTLTNDSFCGVTLGAAAFAGLADEAATGRLSSLAWIAVFGQAADCETDSTRLGLTFDESLSLKGVGGFLLPFLRETFELAW